MTIAAPGKRMRCGAANTALRSIPIIEPHSASGGWAPMPRNERAATSMIAAAIPSVPWTMIGVRAFGMIRRRRIPSRDSPRAREAATNSCSRIERTDARVTRA